MNTCHGAGTVVGAEVADGLFRDLSELEPVPHCSDSPATEVSRLRLDVSYYRALGDNKRYKGVNFRVPNS